MNKKILIKICGIKSPEMAAEIAKIGAVFIGVVFHSASRRSVNISTAKRICEFAENNGAKTVGVFVNQSLTEIIQICESTGIQIVQLHGKTSKSASQRLPQHLRQIYQIDGKLDNEDQANIEKLEKKRDFLIYDHSHGYGKSLDIDTFRCPIDFPFFIAGGLRIHNIEKAIRRIKPNGVDISSGVENETGEKDLNLIRTLIEKIKEGEMP